MVLSIIAYSLSGSAARDSKRRCHTPLLAQRLNRLWVFFQSPNRCGRSRHGISAAVAVEHRFDESAIVVGGDADITGFAGQQVLDSLPLVIAKCISVHRSALFQADPSWITQTVAKVDSFYYTIPSVDSFYVQPSK